MAVPAYFDRDDRHAINQGSDPDNPNWYRAPFPILKSARSGRYAATIT
jgi:hypothetical protein